MQSSEFSTFTFVRMGLSSGQDNSGKSIYSIFFSTFFSLQMRFLHTGRWVLTPSKPSSFIVTDSFPSLAIFHLTINQLFQWQYSLCNLRSHLHCFSLCSCPLFGILYHLHPFIPLLRFVIISFQFWLITLQWVIQSGSTIEQWQECYSSRCHKQEDFVIINSIFEFRLLFLVFSFFCQS